MYISISSPSMTGIFGNQPKTTLARSSRLSRPTLTRLILGFVSLRLSYHRYLIYFIDLYQRLAKPSRYGRIPQPCIPQEVMAILWQSFKHLSGICFADFCSCRSNRSAVLSSSRYYRQLLSRCRQTGCAWRDCESRCLWGEGCSW